MRAVYNEIDAYCCAWLSNLMDAGHITPGKIIDKSIEDIFPDELSEFDRCHFFAGIGVWDYVFNRSGVGRGWSGSAPCQPFSAAGKGGGFDDERHLWPAFYHLINECEPPVVFGEQVASPDGLAWIDLVQSDMEGARYTFATFDLCAAGVGAPHIRQRLYWVGDGKRPRLEGLAGDGVGEAGWPLSYRSIAPAGFAGALAHANDNEQWQGRGPGCQSAARNESGIEPGRCGSPGTLADASGRQLSLPEWGSQSRDGDGSDGADDSVVRVVANSAGEQWDTRWIGAASQQSGEIIGLARHGTASQQTDEQGGVALDGRDWRPGAVNGFWRDADWLLCRDGKWRPVRPGSFPLVNGATARMGRLRAYGNAIVAPLAEEFVSAWLECEP